MPKPTRAYRGEVLTKEAARRIVHALQTHVAAGRPCAITDYTQRAETIAAVWKQLSPEVRTQLTERHTDA